MKQHRRVVFLIPDLVAGKVQQLFDRALARSGITPVKALLLPDPPALRTPVAWGGTLNIMRHCWVARQRGADAVLATPSGNDTYGSTWGVHELPFVRWDERRPTDVCIVPDFCSGLIDDVEGRAVAYLQVPTSVQSDFDYASPRVELWTDSPFMLDLCRSTYPGQEIEIVPNIVDDTAFPFIPQSEREQGVLFAFPRKGPEFIAATERRYRDLGGSYWNFELIDGLPFHEFARAFRRPQAFLASAQIEGAALPPQESMAAGVVVVGRTARGANFVMEHGETAMVAETPEEAAHSLSELENGALRERLAIAAHARISRYFPDGEPDEFWRAKLAGWDVDTQ